MKSITKILLCLGITELCSSTNNETPSCSDLSITCTTMNRVLKLNLSEWCIRDTVKSCEVCTTCVSTINRRTITNKTGFEEIINCSTSHPATPAQPADSYRPFTTVTVTVLASASAFIAQINDTTTSNEVATCTSGTLFIITGVLLGLCAVLLAIVSVCWIWTLGKLKRRGLVTHRAR